MTPRHTWALRSGERLPSDPKIRPYYSWRQCRDDLTFEFYSASPPPSLEQIRSRAKELFEDAQHNGRRTPVLTDSTLRDNAYAVRQKLTK